MYVINVVSSDENKLVITDDIITVNINNTSKSITTLCNNLHKFIQESLCTITYDKSVNLEFLKEIVSCLNKTLDECKSNNINDISIIDDFYTISPEDQEKADSHNSYKTCYKEKVNTYVNRLDKVRYILYLIKQNTSLFKKIKSSSDIVRLIWKLYRVELTLVEGTTILARLAVLLI